MGIVDREQRVVVPYSINDTFSAVENAVMKLSDFKVDSIDNNMKVIHLKAGISLFSWGENVAVSLESTPTNHTSISIVSTPKTGVGMGGLVDMGKNRKNIEKLMEAISHELNNFSKIQNEATNMDMGSTNNFDNDMNNDTSNNPINTTNSTNNLCIQCGNKLKSTDKFCNNCGRIYNY